ncbi:MAG TPA: DUF3971 domain-containing protein [Alphaproteobacteria bacterium]|nr:DUF3971 domain-containing protein [Alphaproteobacteria bacterium]
MVRRSARILVEVLGTIVAGIAILVAVTAWRLSQGPITLSLLTPYVEEALSAPDRGFIVRIDRTVLAWGGWERTLDLEGVGIHVIDPAGQPLLTLPEISLRLSARALIEGVVAPTSLEVSGAQLHLRRNAEGRFNLEFADQSVSQVRSNVLPAMLEDMLRRPDRERPISFLRRITITNANLVVEGSRWDTSWKAQLPRLVLERDAAGLRAAAVLDLHVQDLASHFDARGLYNATTRTLSLDVAFGGLNPATVAQAAPELAPMAHFSLPFAGKIHVQFEPDGSLGALNFDVSAGEGRLVLRELYSADLDVKSLAAKGALAEHGTALTLDEADIDLGGTTFTLHGTAHEIDGNSTATLDVVGKGVKVDDLPKLWPASVAGNPRAWITANLSAGMVDDLYASIEAHGHGPDFKDLDFDRVNGSMRLSGIDVRYLEKMPKVRGAGGEVHFDEKSFNIAIDKGGAEGLAVDSGTIAITGLDGEDQRMAIDLALHGPLVAAAQLADHEPLHYVSKLGLDPKKMAGDSVIRLVLKFPLLHDLRLAQIDASASGDMKNISMASMFMGHDLSRGNVALKVDKAGMQATGEATIGPVPVSLSWSETFGRLPERRIRLAGDLDDQARKTLGLDAPGILRGPVHAELDLKGADHGPTRADLALDLTKARLRLPEIDWRKLPGATGKAHATLILSGEKLSAIPDFAVEAPDLALHGEVSFDAASGAFSAARLDRLAIFRDRLAVAVTRRPDDGYAIELRGDAFDAAPFLKDTGNEPKEPGATLAIALGVKRLWLSQSADVPLSDASATIDYDGRRASRAVFDAKTASGAPFHLEIVAEDGKRRLAISTDNAGDVLRAVDFADNVVGGKLRIAGTYDDTKADPPLSGILRMTDFKLLQAPFPVKLLTVTSPADAGERLSGEGIGFSALIAPFTRTGTRVAIKDGRTVGSELGLTFEGWLDPDANQLRIEGTIVPIYTLNSLLGNIPGLNEVLVGPKGGGTFAATYVAKGKLDDPDVTVNPLSALAPGILRELVRGLFGGGSDLTPEPSDQVKPMQGGG